jgi:tRNA1Val (adenine37-N6)-methyltransferase
METTRDAFLGGRVLLDQPVQGYRAGLDAVLLAAAVESMPGLNFAEAGCGAGAALLMAAIRRPDAKFTGIEKDGDAGALACANATLNGVAARVGVNDADLLHLPHTAKTGFDVVFANPPFFDDESAIRPPHPTRHDSFIAGCPLSAWVHAMLDLCSARGRILIIHRAERLGDLFAALAGKAGDIVLYPVRPRMHDPAKRIILSARKGAKGPVKLLRGLDLHGEAGERFTPEAQAIFDGAMISLYQEH